MKKSCAKGLANGSLLRSGKSKVLFESATFNGESENPRRSLVGTSIEHGISGSFVLCVTGWRSLESRRVTLVLRLSAVLTHHQTISKNQS